MSRTPQRIVWVAITFLLFPVLSCTGEMDDEEGDRAGECSDGEDNDGDGSTDCDDSGCDVWASCVSDDDDAGDDDAGDDDAGDDDSAAFAGWDLCINEFMAANATTIPDETGAFPDWIELYNLGHEDVALGGYTLSDDLDEPSKHELSDELVLPAFGYLLLWADGSPDLGANHLGFQLSRDGEELGLYHPSGSVINHLEYDEQATDWSAARIPDGVLDAWVIDTTPTPGHPNE